MAYEIYKDLEEQCAIRCGKVFWHGRNITVLAFLGYVARKAAAARRRWRRLEGVSVDMNED